MVEREDILDGVHRLVRPAILNDGRFGVESCVLTSRVAYEVLTALGVDADVVAAEVRVMNPALAAAYAAADDPSTLTRADVPDGHAVDLGTDSKRGPRALHVIVLTGHDLLDLSLDQASRPQHAMPLTPLWLRLSPSQMDQLRAGMVVDTLMPSGVVLVYRLRLQDRYFTTSPNWGRRDRLIRRRIVGHVIRRIREKVGSGA